MVLLWAFFHAVKVKTYWRNKILKFSAKSPFNTLLYNCKKCSTTLQFFSVNREYWFECPGEFFLFLCSPLTPITYLDLHIGVWFRVALVALPELLWTNRNQEFGLRTNRKQGFIQIKCANFRGPMKNCSHNPEKYYFSNTQHCALKYCFLRFLFNWIDWRLNCLKIKIRHYLIHEDAYSSLFFYKIRHFC